MASARDDATLKRNMAVPANNSRRRNCIGLRPVRPAGQRPKPANGSLGSSLMWGTSNAVALELALRVGAALLAVVRRAVNVTGEQHRVHLLEYHSDSAPWAHHDGKVTEGR